MDDKYAKTVNLLSRESSSGVWDADEPLILPEIATHFTLSVFIQLGEERQLLASKKLYGSELRDRLGEPVVILLDGHENYPTMILKTTVEAATIPGKSGASGTSSTKSLRDTEEIDRVIEQGKEAVSSIPDGHPDKPRRLYNLGTAFLIRFERLGNLDDISDAITQLQAVVNLTPDGHPDKPGQLNNLGTSLLTRFERLGDRVDIDSAVDRFQSAVNLTPGNHPNKSSRLINFGNSLLIRFEHLKNPDDIDVAIAQHRAAVNLTPDDHPNKPSQLNNLGSLLKTRFERLGNMDDLNNAIEQHRAAVNLTPDGHPDKFIWSYNFGSCLLTRFECVRNPDDIDDAITQHQSAFNLTPNSHPGKPSQLNNLGNSFLTRFECFGNVGDIDNAVERYQAVVNLTPDGHPSKPDRLNNLGNSLRVRFIRLEKQEDIDNAIGQLQAAVRLTTDNHPKKPTILSNLGIALGIRFERFGDMNDIDNAISRLQAAVEIAPDGHPDKFIQLNNLGNYLRIRFKRLGKLEDIDNAILRLQAAVQLTPDGHPDKPTQLNNLGIALILRYERLWNPDDIGNAISRLQAAVKLTPDGHPIKSDQLNNLGLALTAQFERLKSPGGIDNAVEQHRAAVNLLPDGHPGKPRQLTNLGSSLLIRFQHLGKLDDIDNAIEQHQLAVNLTPDGHPDMPSRLGNLGSSLGTRFEHLKDLDDIDKALKWHQAAVNLIPDGHPDKVTWLYNCGNTLLLRFQHLGQSQDAEACISRLSAAALSSVGAPSLRFQVAKKWMHAAFITQHTSLLAACECAIGIIPLVAWLGLSIPDRHQHLTEIGGFVRDAASIAISLGEYDKALEWLEQGRSIVWTQILQLRTPVDQLRSVEPNLADRLLYVSQLLDRGIQDGKFEKDHKQSREEEARQYRALAMERDAIVEKVRLLPNFEDFLKPLPLHRLIKAAKVGPVVIINVSKPRCDALALVYGIDEAIHIPLPDLTPERVTELQSELKDILKSNGVRIRAERLKEFDISGDAGCERTLAELWDHLVQPVLDSLAFSSNPDTLPRIWWCVTGSLAFLPIHAAGIYGTDDSSQQIQNYTISSYTPTISTLLEPPEVAGQKPFRHLSVIEPSSGASYIPNTEKELEHIRRRLHNRDHVVLHKTEATKKRMMKEMGDCNWLHLACHGIQNARNPTKSALSLHDGKLTLEEIIKLDLPHAEFAFLSACQTMTGDEDLSEEAVHIAGGMSLAGYRSVVATMWSIEDALAPKVADEFYAHLLEDGERPDNRKAAEALHFAIKKLRGEKDIQMISWIPFVHLGI